MATFTSHHERYQHNHGKRYHLTREKIETGRSKNVLAKLCSQEVEEPGFELRCLHARLHCDIQTPFPPGKAAGPLSGTTPNSLIWQAPESAAEMTTRREPVKCGV